MLIRFPAWICLTCIAITSFVTIAVSQTDKAQAAEALTDLDRKLDCPGVRAAVADIAVQIKRNDAVLRKETATPPSSLAQMLQSAPPIAATLHGKTLRQRSTALTKLSTDKGCNRIDEMSKSRLGGAIKSNKPPVERCDVRGELSLQDCAEDVAKWRCRAESGKGRVYLVCLEQVAERVITASGYDVTVLASYEPGCADITLPATCSVFANNRSGPDAKWCKRVNEASIEVCEPPKGTPALAAVAADKTPNPSASPAASKTLASTLPNGTTCRPLPCQLGTSCNRLCAPPD
jgi:hypothetical protein